MFNKKITLATLKKKYTAICKECIQTAKDIVELEEQAARNEDNATFRELEQKWSENIMRLEIIREVLGDITKL